ncbi:MAG: SusC/RagA family TonB-linked outer membrane protein [Clostridium sp.]|nr:SusC/RagA family TonB-linked outer membrane protein [Clostridium sp.]
MKLTYNTILLSAAAAMCAISATAQEAADSSKVHVAFRDVDQAAVVGGTKQVDVEALSEKRFATYSLNDMQSFVGGYNGQLWNQGEALVLVDGVPRDANNVLPSEIATITFLKSAQAVVLYGPRAAKGVILITTKRGNDATGLSVNVHGNASVFVPKSYPKYLGSAEYMTLYNEARLNDGLEAAFTPEDIYNYSSGKNIYRYPNTNFFSDDYLKKNYWLYQGTAEFRGGGKYATFYANIDLYHNDDLINFGEGKKNGTTRLSVRGNIDLKLNDWVGAWINTSATFYDARNDNANYWSNSSTLRPTNPGSSPLVPLIPIDMLDPTDQEQQTYLKNSMYLIDGKYLIGGTQNYATNPFAAMYAAGYNTWTSRQLQFDAGVKLNLGRLLEGLRFQAQFGVDYSTSYTTSINNDYATYEATWDDALGYDIISSLKKYNIDKRTATQNVGGSTERQTILFNAFFDYNRTFGGAHNVGAMLLANGYQQSYTEEYHRTSNVNLGLNLSYNYASKYFAEFSGAMAHSSKLAPGHRNAFSPTGALAWRISQEDFLKDASWLNELKLNVTGGIVNQDLDIEDYYMYEDVFTSTNTWWGWNESANALQTFDSHRGRNYDLTFVKRKEFTVGLDASMFNNQVQVSANYFNTTTSGLLGIPAIEYPNYFQTWWPVSDLRPYANLNDQRRQGVDFGVRLTKKFGDFSASLGLNGMYATSKNTKVSENVEYDWLKGEGQNVDALRGYQCLGYFQSEEEIANSAVINNTTKPGDLKYKDQNGDGIIDGKDQVVIGKWRAPFTYGVNLTLAYKGFTLFVTGSGQQGGNGVKNNSYMWVYGDGKYSEPVLGRWTPETAATATYPRLTTQGGELNFVTSDYWMYDTDAFYLNVVQLTYDFPSKWFANKFVKGIQLHVQGNNLATISKERKYIEMNVGSAPQCRSYNFGFRVDF